MNEQLSRRTVTFVVRIWAEYLEQDPPAWRGEVQHLESGEKVYLRQPTDVTQFILTCAEKEEQERDEGKGGAQCRHASCS